MTSSVHSPRLKELLLSPARAASRRAPARTPTATTARRAGLVLCLVRVRPCVRVSLRFGRRGGSRRSELAEVGAAVVRGQKVQEALVILRVDVKQREQRAIAARRRPQA